MIEKLYELPDNIDLSVFYGINNANIRLVKDLIPRVKIVARGYNIKITGTEENVNNFTHTLAQLIDFVSTYNYIDEENIVDIVKGNEPKKKCVSDSLIVHGVGGKSIIARNETQQKLKTEFEKNDLVFAVGPAGTGKTYVAIALAVKMLKNKEVKRIILSRPAVEAGEKLGFLPGDMKEKIDPYLRPLYDALEDMIPAAKLNEYIAHNIIQIAPLAFMRGRTLSDAVVILDEAQNTTTQQLKMFLTRLGFGSKMIVTGDLTQIDLPMSIKSGLLDAINKLNNIKGLSIVEFSQTDIVRHRLVQRIVDAYNRIDSKQKTVDK